MYVFGVWHDMLDFDIYLLQLPAGSVNQDTSSGKIAFESLDKLMVTSFDHLESCQDAGRLDQVCHQNAFLHVLMNLPC